MNLHQEIYTALHPVMTGTQSYRELQAVLKLARSRGYQIKTRLNAKKEVLLAEATTLYNLIVESYKISEKKAKRSR